MHQVEKADQEQLAKWYGFLPCGETTEQQKIMDRIEERFKKLGGMTPKLNKNRVRRRLELGTVYLLLRLGAVCYT